MAGHGHSHGGQPDMAALQAMLEAQSKPKELISFRAGQLNMSHNGTTVVADKRRGKLSLVQSHEDGLLHLQWIQRPTGQLQETDDLTIMPRSALFEKVPECKTGRVILLRFRSGGRKRFFWMQEPKDDKDAEYLKKLNDLIDNPPPLEGGAGGMGGMGGMAGAGAFGDFEGGAGGGVAGMDGMEGSLADQQALMDMLSQSNAAQSRPANTPARAAAAASAAPSKTAESKAGSSAAAAKPTGGASSGAGKSGAANTSNDSMLAAMMNAAARDQAETGHGRHSLNDILDTERVLAAGLTDEEIAPLLQYLPEGQRTAGEFRAALRSPQFQQTLRGMSGVLNSTNFGPLVASFGLNPTGNIGVSGFTEAIEADAKRKAEIKAKAGASGAAAAASPASGSGAAASTPAKKADDKKGK